MQKELLAEPQDLLETGNRKLKSSYVVPGKEQN